MKPLLPEVLLRGLKSKVFGRSVLCFDSVGSTNDVVLQLAEAGCPQGVVALSERQTAGRGRQGRKWVSTDGKSLSLSILLRPGLRRDELPFITLAAAVAVARAMESFRFKPSIKWPNDVLLDGRKVCGILTEMGSGNARIVPVVLGIGINLNQTSRDFPRELRPIATSLRCSSGRRVDRVLFFQRLMVFWEESDRWLNERRFTRVLAEWRKRSLTLGRQVKVTQAKHIFYGQVLDVDDEGSLLVRNDHGLIEKVISGDVEVLKI